MGSFTNTVKRWTRKTEKAMDESTTAIALEVFRRVIKRTPVETGRARANWQTSIGKPDYTITEQSDKSGDGAISRALAVLSKRKGDAPAFLANSLPYVPKLEYGGYSEGPRTEGGFSRQAPKGMVRITIAEFDQIVRSKVKKV